jgi:hypothetical protein
MRVERFAPASTGLLIVSIIFANKFWILDATSMSLYWAARLPIKRPKPTSPLRLGSVPWVPVQRAVPDGHKRRRWKIALSLAIVGAVVAPFVFRTYKAHPTYSVWVPLTAEEREHLASSLKNSDRNCQSRRELGIIEDGVVDYINCHRDKEKVELELGGHSEYYPLWLEYLAMNAGVAAATFACVFGLALLIPMFVRSLAFLILRYWKWLNA